ncbi:MAG: Glu-tRNA(Gln) amidotransferase subunit GatE [Candidatus Liptonbacteria bacterium]|nr:Glu-tRNA(Gln) amidotransferase subunit GatE [Candidatus Pacearchaeota archaeon]MBM3257030.1 Glu-tRNA(Gln) amidotransferase subunit GatE [Candidatus Liptonbacteria bacterium]
MDYTKRVSQHTATAYSKIGLKAGLEIHQQLDTGKLFCACPGYLRSEEPHFSVIRRLHAVAGETGEVDAAVAHEAVLGRTFLYQGYNDTTCLVELDEEPPHFVNEAALDEALKIALLLNCEVYPVTQVMRKTVIDGSNTSGFQRTVLLAHDGFIETSFGKVKVDTVCLEEDAARIVSRDEKAAVYRLDRLGIPLVEIATAAVLDTPDKIKETALKLGEILRACKVKRGIGTIRQDVNISIKGHDRVEVKGFQDPAMMIETVRKEVLRQETELKQGKKEGAVRNALPSGDTEFLRPMPGKARMYPETDLPLLTIGRERLNMLKKILPKLRTEIRDELKKKGLSEEMIRLVLDGHLDEFETLIKIYSKDADLVAKMVVLWRQEFASKLKKSFEEIEGVLNERVLEQVLEALVKGEIGEGDIKGVLWKVTNGAKIEDALKIEKIDDHVIEEKIIAIVRDKPGLRAGAYMGMVIAKMPGVDKRKAMEILNRLVK